MQFDHFLLSLLHSELTVEVPKWEGVVVAGTRCWKSRNHGAGAGFVVYVK